MSTTYGKEGRTGGATTDLDGIDGANLIEGDRCIVITSDPYAYIYRLNATSGAAESDPDVIAPDNNAGQKRWILVAILGAGGVAYLKNILEDITPQLGGDLDTNAHNIGIDDTKAITDESGNEQIKFSTTATAMNELTVKNAATGSGPQIQATGGDTNIDLNLVPKGTGGVVLTRMETIYIDAGAMVPCTTAGAAAGTNEYATNDIEMDYLAFDAGATKERAQFKLVMPENWDRGTFKAKLIVSSATGSTAGDTFEFAVKAGALSDSDAIDAALGTAQVISDTLLADNGGDLQITGATPAITAGGTPALNDLIVFEIYRNTDGTDNMAEDAWLLGCVIQYKVNQAVAAW